MKLKVYPRKGKSKSEINQVRREGNIPAIIYNRNKASETLSVHGNDFTGLLRKVQSGRLPTTIFELVDEKGKVRRALVKEIQYEPTSYLVQHLDFEELLDDVKINVKVPIECTGIADCAGIKLGGVLRQVIRNLRVRCLPKDLPSCYNLDVKSLELFQVKRLSDLEISPAVRPLADLHEVAVVIAKK
jgi:large subunit ribosomal protein L25